MDEPVSFRDALLDLERTKQLVGLGFAWSPEMYLASVVRVDSDCLWYRVQRWQDGALVGERVSPLRGLQMIELRPAADVRNGIKRRAPYAAFDDDDPS